MCDSFFATLECELLGRFPFQNQAEARMAIFEDIEGRYNPNRRHSRLDYLSPMQYERRFTHSVEIPSQNLSAEPG
jgi:putative transposase